MLLQRSGKRFVRFCNEIRRFPAADCPEPATSVTLCTGVECDDLELDFSATG